MVGNAKCEVETRDPGAKQIEGSRAMSLIFYNTIFPLSRSLLQPVHPVVDFSSKRARHIYHVKFEAHYFFEEEQLKHCLLAGDRTCHGRQAVTRRKGLVPKLDPYFVDKPMHGLGKQRQLELSIVEHHRRLAASLKRSRRAAGQHWRAVPRRDKLAIPASCMMTS